MSTAEQVALGLHIVRKTMILHTADLLETGPISCYQADLPDNQWLARGDSYGTTSIRP